MAELDLLILSILRFYIFSVFLDISVLVFVTRATSDCQLLHLETECHKRLVNGYLYDRSSKSCLAVKNNFTGNRDSADRICASQNATLVAIDSEAKMDFILQLIFIQKSTNQTEMFWI